MASFYPGETASALPQPDILYLLLGILKRQELAVWLLRTGLNLLHICNSRVNVTRRRLARLAPLLSRSMNSLSARFSRRRSFMLLNLYGTSTGAISTTILPTFSNPKVKTALTVKTVGCQEHSPLARWLPSLVVCAAFLPTAGGSIYWQKPVVVALAVTKLPAKGQ